MNKINSATKINVNAEKDSKFFFVLVQELLMGMN
jgi:hypothetical protein